MAGIILPDDIRQEQADLRAEAQELNAVRDANPSWTADTEFDAQWKAFMVKVAAFCAIDVGITNTTGALYNEGEALKSEMRAWHERIAARFTGVAPVPAATPKTLLEATPNIVTTLALAAVAIGALHLVVTMKRGRR